MKTKTLILFLLFFTSTKSQMQFSHFPLDQGNKWFFSWMPTVDNSVRTILEATADTLMSDGKIYTRIDRLDKNDTLWTRINGYFFLRENNNVLYKFPGDTMLNYHWNDSTSWAELHYGYHEVHVENTIVFGVSRLTYYLYIYNPYEYVSYTDSIGFNALHALEWRDWLEVSRYLVGCIIKGKTYGDIVTSIDSKYDQNIYAYKLFQNYPNPFNPLTTIKYTIPHSDNVSLKIYDILGKNVMTLVNEYKKSGNYEVVLNAGSFSSGIYFYKIITGNYIDTKKLMILK